MVVKPSSQSTSDISSGCQARTAKGATSSTVTTASQARMVGVLSVLVSRLVVRVMPHQASAAAIAIAAPGRETSAPGRSITATPAKPASVPAHRANPTRSPSSGCASRVVNITLVKERTVAVAKSR